MEQDTIAAVASGMTASGIGIIRISGPEVFLILSRIFRPRRETDVTKYKANTVHYGHIVRNPKDGNTELVDECLVTILRAPHSYTAEDTVEINTHGGTFVMQRVLDTVLSNGARAAEPGEFTKRAFLNGRIDLSEAEAVMDVIRAGNEDALTSSLMQLSGSVRNAISELRETILNELSFIEAALDDPEHYELSGYGDKLAEVLSGIMKKLRKMSDTFGEGRLIREGIMTVILGKPNAGKSTLLNMLTGSERAIVTDIEGTTRDILEEQVVFGNVTLRMIDTAGIRDARDMIEQIGIMKTREYVDKADLILAVFDSARPLDRNDDEILSMISGRRAVVLLNKSDLENVLTVSGIREMIHDPKVPVITLSAKEGLGIEELQQTVRDMFFSGEIHLNEEVVITNARHRRAIDEAMQSLKLVQDSIDAGMPEDFYSIDLMDAYSKLGEIIGEETGDDLIDMIFSRFCMGK